MKRTVIALLTASAGLTGLGLVMLATWQYAQLHGGCECTEVSNVLAEQMVGAAVGWFLLWTVSHVDYRYWEKVALPFFAMVLVLLFGNWIPSIGLDPSPHRMISIDVLAHVQPAVIAGWSGILFLAWWYGARRPSNLGWVPFAALGGLMMVLLAYPNFGAVLWLLLAGAPVMILGKAGRGYVILFVICVMNGIIWIITQSPSRIWRLAALLSAESLREGPRSISKIALESRGWTDVGLASGNWTIGGFPMTAGNWTAAHIGEVLGVPGLLAITGLYLTVLVSGGLIAVKARWGFGRLLGTGIVSLTGASIILNLATLAAPGYITPPALPFVSNSGLGLCMNLLAVGILVSIARNIDKRDLKFKDFPVAQLPPRRSRQG